MAMAEALASGGMLGLFCMVCIAFCWSCAEDAGVLSDASELQLVAATITDNTTAILTILVAAIGICVIAVSTPCELCAALFGETKSKSKKEQCSESRPLLNEAGSRGLVAEDWRRHDLTPALCFAALTREYPSRQERRGSHTN